MKESIWFDFENAPHVWVFSEIISVLAEEYEVVVTIRDFSSTTAISKLLKINGSPIGKGGGKKSNLSKFSSVLSRAFELRRYLRNNQIKPKLAISHCSRSQALACYFLNIPLIYLDDYEFTFNGFHHFTQNLLTPFVIPKKVWGLNAKKVIHYPGLKEELYLWNEIKWKQAPLDLIDNNRLNLIFRPEGYNTHYCSPLSQILQSEIIELFAHNKDFHIILISRDKSQEKILSEIFEKNNVNYSIPSSVINGPALISQCDAVIGGGGTMTREACVLKVPSYSFFGGKLGAVDKYLEAQNLLHHIKCLDDVSKLIFRKKDPINNISVSPDTFNFVVDFLIQKIRNIGSKIL